jgi:membrane-bound lytic murein transglycosylase D
LVDERRDPLKSSDAAARYLRDLYDIFDDWTLAIAAYNCGPKNVNKAITRSGGRRSFWEIYNYLPRETRGYIPDYTAATYIMNYYEKHGLKPNNISVPIETDTLNITKNLFFGQITKFIDIDITQLKILNPQYKENIIPGENMHCYLRLPIEHIPQFIRLQDSIFEFGKDSLVQEIVQEIRPMEQITHIVRKNETWSKIAKKYGVSVNQLRKWNPRLKNTLRIGQRMIIQRNNPLYKQIKQSAPKLIEKTAKAEKDTVMTAESKIENTNNANAKNDNVSTTKKEKYHTVKSGDSLYSIAKKYKTTVNKLRALNNFKSQTLQIGQKVRVQ